MAAAQIEEIKKFNNFNLKRNSKYCVMNDKLWDRQRVAEAKAGLSYHAV